MEETIIIYKDGWRRTNYCGAVVIKETEKMYKIRPFKSGHYNGYCKQVRKEGVVFTTTDGAKAIEKLKLLKETKEWETSEINKISEECRSKIIKILQD